MDVDDEDGRQQHLGFVQFTNAEAAAAAQKALDGSELSQQRIRVRSQRGGKAGSGDKGSQGADQAAAQPSAEPSPPSTPQAAGPATTTEATPDTSTTSSSTTTPTAAPGSDDSQSSSEQAPSQQEGAAASPEGADDEKAAATATTSRSKAYRQRQKQNLPPAGPSTLFVPNMRQKTTKQELAEHFRDQPGVEAVFVRVAMGRRYDGYVQFTSPENTTAAMQALAGTELNSKPLRMLIHEGPGRKRTQEPEAAAVADSASGADGAAEQPKPKQQRKQPETQGSSKADSTSSSDAAQPEAPSSDNSSNSTQEASSSSSSSSRKKKVRGETRGQSFSVKVSNLAWSTTRDSLEAHFKDCKDYKTCVTIPNAEGRPSGVGFVRFSTAAGAQAAVEAKQESELDGRAIKVTLQEQRAAKPAAAADGGSGGRAAWALQAFNLAYDATEQDLLDHFGGCKGFQGAFIATGRDNRPSGTGFVVFDSEEAQAAAYKAKQGTELVGRTVYLRSTRPGRVEAAGEGSSAADTAAATAAAEAPAATASSADSNTQPSALLLLGLPPSFTWREVTGLCSFFGGVRNVTRTRSDWKSGSSTGAAADAGETGGPDLARQGQPCFVNMDSVEAVGRAVAALNGHTVQGHKLVAGFATPKKPKAVAGKQQDNAE